MDEKMLKTKKGKLCKFSNKKFANTLSRTHFCLFDSQLKRRSATSLMCQMERPRKSIAQREKTRSPSLFHKQAVNCICTSGYQPSDYQLWVRSRRNAKPRMWKFTLKRRRKGHNKEIITSSILHMSNRLSRQLERMWPRVEQRRHSLKCINCIYRSLSARCQLAIFLFFFFLFFICSYHLPSIAWSSTANRGDEWHLVADKVCCCCIHLVFAEDIVPGPFFCVSVKSVSCSHNVVCAAHLHCRLSAFLLSIYDVVYLSVCRLCARYLLFS